MVLPRVDPESLPAHVLFPDEYRRSARMIVRDFVFFGGVFVLSIVLAALVRTRF